MGLGIPAGVLFSYNNYTFPSNVRSKVTEEPIQSGDGRVVKYSKISIHVSGFLTQDDIDAAASLNGIGVVGGTLDAFMNALRRRLQVNGKNLVYQNKGYGKDLNVNPAVDVAANPGATPSTLASVRDVAFGPRASRLSWWPLGGSPDGCHGAGFEWEISTQIAECESFPVNPGPSVFVEISYTVNYDCDEAGLVKITTNGTAQIPLSLRNGTIDHTIDDSIELIIRPTPTGFLRTHSRELSADRASVSFSITDTQIEIPYPKDVVKIDMRHRIKQKAPKSYVWDCVISGTVRLSPTANRFLAWRRFFAIAAQRMAFARRHAVVGLAFVGGVRRGIFVRTTEMDENLFSNESRFSISYTMLGAPFEDVVKVSGLWRPIMPADGDVPLAEEWDATSWTASLEENAQQFKGILQASFKAADDIILDVCAGNVADPVSPGELLMAITPDQMAEEAETSDDDFEEFGLEQLEGNSNDGDITPALSWIDWQCMPSRLVNHNNVVHKPLTGTVTDQSNQSNQTTSPDPLGEVAAVADDVTAPQSTYNTGTQDIIQQLATPTMRLRLRGYGIRVGYRVNQPKLLSYGGQTPVLQYEDVSEETVGIAVGITAYRTNWDLIYLIPGPSAGIPLLANPAAGTDGNSGS